MAALCREEDLDDLLPFTGKIGIYFLWKPENAAIYCGASERKAGIEPFVYMDFIDGLSSKDSAVEFVKYYTSAAGIVTTKSNQVRRAKALDLLAIQRFCV